MRSIHITVIAVVVGALVAGAPGSAPAGAAAPGEDSRSNYRRVVDVEVADVYSLAVSPEGRVGLVSDSYRGDGIVQRVDLRAGAKPTGTASFGVAEAVIAAGGRLAYSFGSDSGGIDVLDISAPRPRIVRSVQLGLPKAGGPSALALSPDGAYLYVGYSDDYKKPQAGVAVFALSDPQQPRRVANWVNQGKGGTSDVAVTPDGSRLVLTDSAMESGPLVVLDVTRPRSPRLDERVPLPTYASHVVSSPGDPDVAYVAGFRTVSRVDLDAGTVTARRKLEGYEGIDSLVVAGDGCCLVVTVDTDPEFNPDSVPGLRFLDRRSLADTLPGRTGWTNPIDSPGALAVAADDGSGRFWQLDYRSKRGQEDYPENRLVQWSRTG